MHYDQLKLWDIIVSLDLMLSTLDYFFDLFENI